MNQEVFGLNLTSAVMSLPCGLGQDALFLSASAPICNLGKVILTYLIWLLKR